MEVVRIPLKGWCSIYCRKCTNAKKRGFIFIILIYQQELKVSRLENWLEKKSI